MDFRQLRQCFLAVTMLGIAAIAFPAEAVQTQSILDRDQSHLQPNTVQLQSWQDEQGSPAIGSGVIQGERMVTRSVVPSELNQPIEHVAQVYDSRSTNVSPPAPSQGVYAQPVQAQPVNRQPVQAQPVYAQPAYDQPVYAQQGTNAGNARQPYSQPYESRTGVSVSMNPETPPTDNPNIRQAQPVRIQRTPDPVPVVESIEFEPATHQLVSERIEPVATNNNTQAEVVSPAAEVAAPAAVASNTIAEQPAQSDTFYDPFAESPDPLRQQPKQAPPATARVNRVNPLDAQPAVPNVLQQSQTLRANSRPRYNSDRKLNAPISNVEALFDDTLPPATVRLIRPETLKPTEEPAIDPVPNTESVEETQLPPIVSAPLETEIRESEMYAADEYPRVAQQQDHYRRQQVENSEQQKIYPSHRPHSPAYGQLTAVTDSFGDQPNYRTRSQNRQPRVQTTGAQSMASGPAVTITPLLSDANKPGDKTQVAAFLVANDGTESAHDVNVEFTVDGDAQIESVFPSGQVLGHQRARIRFAKIEAGESREVVVGTFSSTEPDIMIRTRLITETVQSFPVQNRYAQENRVPLLLTIEGPDAVVVGEQTTFRAVAKNTTGKAIENPFVSIDLNAGMALLNPDDAIQGTNRLEPGQKMEAVFTTIAAEAGSVPMVLTAGGSGLSENVHHYDVAARIPAMEVTIDGPELINIGSEADFGLRIKNTTLHPLTSINVKLHLPHGLDVTVLDRDATIDSETNSINWYIPVIKTGFSEIIRFRGRGTSNGEHSYSVSIEAKGHPEVEKSFNAGVIGQSQIGLHIQNAPYSLPVDTPVGVTFLIDNRNIRDDKGVQMNVFLPEGVAAYPSDLFEIVDDGRMLVFHPFDLPSGGGQKIVLYMVGETAGTKPIRANITSGVTRAVNADTGELLFHDVPVASSPMPVQQQRLSGSTMPKLERR